VGFVSMFIRMNVRLISLRHAPIYGFRRTAQTVLNQRHPIRALLPNLISRLRTPPAHSVQPVSIASPTPPCRILNNKWRRRCGWGNAGLPPPKLVKNWTWNRQPNHQKLRQLSEWLSTRNARHALFFYCNTNAQLASAAVQLMAPDVRAISTINCYQLR